MTVARDAAEDPRVAWAADVAELCADALVDAGVFPVEAFPLARDVIAEEIAVRLALHDDPPPPAE